ncbi:MAG: cytochrome c-type biogenesis protein CcmH, partial [Anaerolineae bacterium]
RHVRILLFGILCMVAVQALIGLPLHAQQATPVSVSDDQVNAVAARMYCPSCQGVPLDDCGTQVCAEWRQEIRQQLEAGRTEDEIIAAFVERYGERIVGTPQNPTLRAFSLVTPYLIGGGVLLIGAWTLIRWWTRRHPVSDAELPKSEKAQADEDKYRARIEKDLHL